MPAVQNYASDAAIANVYGTIGALPANDQPDIALQTLVAVCTLVAAGSAGGGLTNTELRATPVPVIDSNSGPASNAVAITPGAGAITQTRALFIGTGGNVTVTMAGGGSVQFTNVPSGTTLPIAVNHVTAATAADIVALW